MIFHNLDTETEAEFKAWEEKAELAEAVRRVARVQNDHDTVLMVYSDRAYALMENDQRLDDGYELCCGLYDDDVKLIAKAYLIMATGKGVPGSVRR